VQDDLGDGVEGERGGVDHQMVVARVGRLGSIEAAHVSVAGPVGHVPVTAGLVLADPLDGGALRDAESRRPVESHVEPAALAEHHRRAPAQDHARVGVGQAADALFAVAAEVLFLAGGRRR
jgi:hypothetical protein